MSMIDDQELTLAEIMDGKGPPFGVDGVSFRIRPPTTEEYDDALAIERMIVKRWVNDPALAPLKDEPCSPAERNLYETIIRDLDQRFHAIEDGSSEKDSLLDQIAAMQRAIEKRTMLDEVAGERAQVARDRYLTQRCLQDAQGRPVFSDLRAPDFPERWEALPMKVKNAARPAATFCTSSSSALTAAEL